MADFALSVKLWPAWPPEESPVMVSGTVESVEAIGFVDLLGLLLLVLMFGVGYWGVVMSGRVGTEGNDEGEFRHDVNRV